MLLLQKTKNKSITKAFMKFNSINKSVMRGFGSALVNMAMIASPFSVGGATNAYYASKKASNGNNSYLIDDYLKDISSKNWKHKLKSSDKGTAIEKSISADDLVLNKSRAIRELVIVDSQVKNAALFSKMAKPGVEVVTISAGTSGFDELMNALGKYENLKAVHLFSHNHKGQLLLGNQIVDQNTLEGNVQAFNAFNRSIEEQGELLIYNCDLENHNHDNGLLEIVKGNVKANVKSMSADHSIFADDLELSLAKGNPDAKPEAGSIALNRLEDFSFTGIINMETRKTNGSFGVLFDGAINAQAYEGPSKNYVLTFNGQSYATGYYGPGGNIYSSNDEKSVMLSFDGGHTFTANSIDLKVYQPRTVDITSNLGIIRAGVALTSTEQTINLNSYSNFAGISSLTITASGSTYMYLGMDDFNVTNLGGASNNAPIATAPSAPTVLEDATNVALADNIQVTDTDGDSQTVTFTVTGGTVSLGTTGITFGGSGNGTASFTAAGTLAAINTALDAATFTPTANLNGTNAGTIAFKSNDGTIDSNTASVSFNITAVNDAPTATGVPTDITVTEDIATNFDLSAVTISDVDGDALTVTLAASGGTFTASSGGVTIGGNGTGSLTLAGTATNINTYFDTQANIKYTGASNVSGDNADTFTLNANDATVNPQVGSGNIDITAVNDAPSASGVPSDVTVTED
ncbi:MAG: hypothetical protein ACJAWO_002030, partial [Halieaceae bacterium]